jgi:hypothetical protein
MVKDITFAHRQTESSLTLCFSLFSMHDGSKGNMR